MLKKLTIQGFKSIQSLVDFELKNLNVLIGANRAGKSNFIDFFHMLSAMMKRDGLREFIAANADAYLFGGAKQTQQIIVKMTFGENGYDFELMPTEEGFFLINNEAESHFSSNIEHEIEIYGTRRTEYIGNANFNSQLLQLLTTEQNYIHKIICTWKIYHFHDTSKLAGMRRYHDQGHDDILFTDAANIAPFLYKLKTHHVDAYKDIIETIRLVMPFFDDFILIPNDNEQLRLNWRQTGLKSYPMRPSQLSDGAMRFICLTTALLQPEPPSTLIIDEPELGLHPYALEILAELFDAASQRMQVIIATQSPALVDCFEPKHIIMVNRHKGASQFERLNQADLSMWLEDYSLGDLWRKNVIEAHPRHE